MFLNGAATTAAGACVYACGRVCVCERGCSQWMLVIEVIGVTPS